MYERIGYGRFSNVFRAMYEPTGKIYAVKVIKKKELNICYISNEIRLGSLLEHHNIARVYFMYQNETHYFIAMEHLEGTTLDNLINTKLFTEDEARVFVYEITKALHYLHAHGLVHRDIKPGNIMVTKNGIKIIDFGTIGMVEYTCGEFSNIYAPDDGYNDEISSMEALKAKVKSMEDPKKTMKKRMKKEREKLKDLWSIKKSITEKCGTCLYLPPEGFDVRPRIHHKSDVWALGVLIYKMVTGKDYFIRNNSHEVEFAIKLRKIELRGRGLSDDLVDLLSNIFQREYKDRYDIIDVLKSKWMKPVAGDKCITEICTPCGKPFTESELLRISRSLVKEPFSLCDPCETKKKIGTLTLNLDSFFRNESTFETINKVLVETKFELWGISSIDDLHYRKILRRLFYRSQQPATQKGVIKHSKEVKLELDTSLAIKKYFGEPPNCLPFRDTYDFLVAKMFYERTSKRIIYPKTDIFRTRLFLQNVVCRSLRLYLKKERGFLFDVHVYNEEEPRIIIYRHSGSYSDFQKLYNLITSSLEKVAKIATLK